MSDDDVNRCELRGRLATDPEMRYTPKGTAVTNARIATNRWVTGANGERRETVDYESLVAWDQLAKAMVGDLRKGDRLHVRGRLQTRSWEGQDGKKRYTTEVVVEEIIPTRGRASVPALDEEVPF